MNALLIFGALLGLAGLALVFLAQAKLSASRAHDVVQVLGGSLMGAALSLLLFPAQISAQQPRDTVSLDPVSSQVVGGEAFDVAGRATVSADNALWVIIYRPDGGYDIAGQVPVTGQNASWSMTGKAVAGRPPEPPAGSSPDKDQTYTVAAVIVTPEQSREFRKVYRSAGGDGAYVDEDRPPGQITDSKAQVTVSK